MDERYANELNSDETVWPQLLVRMSPSSFSKGLKYIIDSPE